MESIHLNLHTDALIGNKQICVLGYVLQKSRVVSLHVSIRKLRCIACVQTCIALNDVVLVLGIISRTYVAISYVLDYFLVY